MLTGSCLCGAVQFKLTGPLRDAGACHCTQCRKQSGHVWASAEVDNADIEISGQPRWFAASDTARRGFCPTCGSFLFWQANGSDEIGVALGAIDGPTGITAFRHIFTANKGDYYAIASGEPCVETE